MADLGLVDAGANIWKGQEPVSKELLLQAGSEAHLMARAQDPQGVQQVPVRLRLLISCAFAPDLLHTGCIYLMPGRYFGSSLCAQVVGVIYR